MMAKRAPETPGRLSRLTAAVSGALIAGLLGYLVVHALRAGEPPAIVAEVVPGETWSRDGVTYLAIDVTNEGDLSARDIVVEVIAEDGTREVRRTTIDFLAGGETQRFYVVVPGPVDATAPATGERPRVRILVAGFEES